MATTHANPAVYWCIARHAETNHLYDGYLPYEFHLRMVVSVYERYLALIDDLEIRNGYKIYLACWGHDLIEDTRCTYSDVKANLGEYAAEIVYAVTNEKGRNRKERANEKYYEGIRSTEGAIFVKLCDRIANVEYSKLTGSKMLGMYRNENRDFMYNLRYMQDPMQYKPMFDYLESLFAN